MLYDQEHHTSVLAVNTRQQLTGKQIKFHYTSPQQPAPASLPYLESPSTLHFETETLGSTYQVKDHLEKAFLQPLILSGKFRSDTSTLCSNISRSDSSNLIVRGQHSSLPSKRYPRVLRHLRYSLLTVYGRLFTLIFLLNVLPLVRILHIYPHSSASERINLDALATAASTNFLIALLVRQDFVVNGIFRTAWLVPWRVPLRVRRWVARCYCYGGIHSGAAVAGTLWWIAFSTLLTRRFSREGTYTVPILVITLMILSLLCGIVVLAAPGPRKRWHNTFELTHRFLGWASIALFWTQLILLTRHTPTSTTLVMPQGSFATILVHTPTFWNLTIITAMTIYPWLRVRRWTFTPELLSSHAVRLHFHKKVHKCSFMSISTSPLREWHPFAIFPSTISGEEADAGPAGRGNSLIISDAGDWTHNLICLAQKEQETQNCQLARHPSPTAKMNLYVRAAPKSGVLSLTILFPRVVIVTTGSGIGPSLSSLLDRPPTQHVRLIWSTRSPLLTYGAEMLALVHRADPDALIIDTNAMGRPDLVRVAWRVAKEMGAEAVFVLGNEKVTRKVVYGLESRGLPAFGPVWDS